MGNKITGQAVRSVLDLDKLDQEISDVKNAIGQKITSPSSPTTGAFLVWNGTAWVAQTLATWQGGNY